jgi:hypothetical protein
MESWQVCTVDLEVRTLERRSVHLVPSRIWMESETVLTQYIITSWSLVYTNQSGEPAQPWYS